MIAACGAVKVMSLKMSSARPVEFEVGFLVELGDAGQRSRVPIARSVRSATGSLPRHFHLPDTQGQSVLLWSQDPCTTPREHSVTLSTSPTSRGWAGWSISLALVLVPALLSFEPPLTPPHLRMIRLLLPPLYQQSPTQSLPCALVRSCLVSKKNAACASKGQPVGGI
jgi:hypothetical protein